MTETPTPKPLPGGLKPWEGSSAAVEQGKHWSSALIWLSAGIFGAGVLMAFTTRMDQTITVRGTLEPTGSSRDVDAAAAGVVSRVLVKEGEEVQAGQDLVELESKSLLSRREAVESTIQILESQNKALGAYLNYKGTPGSLPPIPVLPTGLSPSLSKKVGSALEQTGQIRARLQQLEARIASKEQTLAVSIRIANDLEPLYRSGGVSRIQYLNQRNKVQEDAAELATLREEKTGVLGNTAGQINTNNRDLEGLRSELVQLNETIGFRTVKAPISGTVFNLKATRSAVVSTDQVLLKIIPSNKLQAKVMISNADIGFVKNGMPVTVAVDSFPAGEFGYLKGTLTSIGSDALPPDQQSPTYRFPATVSLKEQRVESGGKALNLQSGMGVSANIRLRSRPAINIISDLFTKQLEGVKRFR